MRKQIRLGGQVVAFDHGATAALYADAITKSVDEEDDDCLLWRSFSAQRSSLYPKEFLGLLSELGADPLKDMGAFIFESEPGQSFSACGGYFVFVGELVQGAVWRPPQVPHAFTFWFTRHFPHNGFTQNAKLCAIEFCTEIPSVVEEDHRHTRKPKATLDNLDENERQVIKECLQATVEGPFFPDWEFKTLFGLERDDLRRILEEWPGVGDTDNYVVLAINNSMNNLLGYPARNKKETWPKFISAGPAEVVGILDKWRGKAPRALWKPRDYFDDTL